VRTVLPKGFERRRSADNIISPILCLRFDYDPPLSAEKITRISP
jgi:hypothetical protein